MISTLIDFILHIDQHLVEISAQYGVWIYAVLFLIIFCETGLVVTPFLPGDSLLFAAGGIAAVGSMNIHVMIALLLAAAILGDAANFMIGKFFGRKLFANPDSKIFRQSYLEKTHAFYEKHGGKTIIIARFVPIVRTFAPFVAGMGSMHFHPLQHHRRGIVGLVVFLCRLFLRQYSGGEKQSGFSDGRDYRDFHPAGRGRSHPREKGGEEVRDNLNHIKRSSENVFQTTFCNRSKLLLINTSIVFQPAVGMAACGVVVRPMEDAALFRPFVFAVEADFIAFFQALDFVG